MYISRDRVIEVLQRLGGALRPGGYLFVGANDILERPPSPLRFVRLGQRHVLWRPPSRPAGPSGTHTPPAGVLVTTNGSAPQMAAAAAQAAATAAQAAGTAQAVAQAAAALPSAMPAGTIPPVTATTYAPATTPGAAAGSPSSSSSSSSSGSFPAFVAAKRASTPVSPARAHALLLEGNTPAALDLVLAVLEADPLSVEARLIAGIAYQLSGDAIQATTALRAALVLAPDLWPALMYLGFALSQLGDETGARRALTRGAQLAATNERLPLSTSVATWFEGWRVDAIEMGRQGAARPRTPSR
jgi:tetratricopeptide (TPR) repeat protein